MCFVLGHGRPVSGFNLGLQGRELVRVVEQHKNVALTELSIRKANDRQSIKPDDLPKMLSGQCEAHATHDGLGYLSLTA